MLPSSHMHTPTKFYLPDNNIVPTFIHSHSSRNLPGVWQGQSVPEVRYGCRFERALNHVYYLEQKTSLPQQVFGISHAALSAVCADSLCWTASRYILWSWEWISWEWQLHCSRLHTAGRLRNARYLCDTEEHTGAFLVLEQLWGAQLVRLAHTYTIVTYTWWQNGRDQLSSPWLCIVPPLSHPFPC